MMPTGKIKLNPTEGLLQTSNPPSTQTRVHITGARWTSLDADTGPILVPRHLFLKTGYKIPQRKEVNTQKTPTSRTYLFLPRDRYLEPKGSPQALKPYPFGVTNLPAACHTIPSHRDCYNITLAQVRMDRMPGYHLYGQRHGRTEL